MCFFALFGFFICKRQKYEEERKKTTIFEQSKKFYIWIQRLGFLSAVKIHSNLLRLAYFQRSNRFHFCNIFFRYDFCEQFSIKFLCGFYFMEWINRCTYDRCTCEYGFVHKTSLRSRHVQLTTKTALNWIIFVIIGI